MQGGDMNTMKKCPTCGNLYSGDLCSKCMAGFAQKPTDPTAPPEDLPTDVGAFATATPEDAAAKADRLHRLEHTLSQLSPKARATLIWHRRDGHTYEEIAERLGISRNMVKKYLAQSLAHCRKSDDREQEK